LQNPLVILDDAAPGRLLRFGAPLAVIQADVPGDVPAALRLIEAA